MPERRREDDAATGIDLSENLQPRPNDFVGRNRKLATNSFYVMGEIFLETLMATPAKAVLQPDPLPALTNDVNQLDERLNARSRLCPFPA